MTAPSTTNTKPTTRSRAIQLVSSGAGDVPTSFFEAGAKSPASSSLGGKHSPKALAFWALKSEARKRPHVCARCAKPNANGHRQCDACRDYSAQYRARKRIKPVTVDAIALAKLERRIGNLEHYFAQLSTENRVSYNRGYCAGRRLHRKSAERASYFAALPTASHEELAQISHEYQKRPH